MTNSIGCSAAPSSEVQVTSFSSRPTEKSRCGFLRQSKVDLVITDLAMPKLNGLRLIQHIIEHDPRASIIAVSGVSPEQLDMAEQFGATRVMFKPLQPEELL